MEANGSDAVLRLLPDNVSGCVTAACCGQTSHRAPTLHAPGSGHHYAAPCRTTPAACACGCRWWGC